MCGIVGCFRTKQGNSGPPVPVEELLAKVKHRGPDDTGIYANNRGKLAHTRLSIIDVSGGHQPMATEDEKLWIGFNGEVYNFRELRSRLDKHRLRTRSDTEVVLHLYEENGPESVRLFDGMFAFAIMTENELFLARDPLGVKPLYYAERNGWLYFASEIKALLPLEARIIEFPPGYWFHSEKGFHRYFELDKWALQGEAMTDPIGTLRMTLKKAVEKRLVADVPVGVFLSGGLDSSIVATLMRPQIEELHSFSVGMNESVDLPYARQMAEFLHTQSHEHIFTESEMRSVLPKVIYHLESFDYALVRSAIANYFVAEMASKFLKVVLVGEGSDELFGGYHYLKDLGRKQLASELVSITAALHNCNLQRLDRMSMAHGLEGREPYLDLELIRTAFSIPLELKQKDGVEKWALRKAFEDAVPGNVVWRTKEKFSRGTGSALVFEQVAESEISDREFERERTLINGFKLRSKEEVYYYRVFRQCFPDSVIDCLGWTAEPGRR